VLGGNAWGFIGWKVRSVAKRVIEAEVLWCDHFLTLLQSNSLTPPGVKIKKGRGQEKRTTSTDHKECPIP